jgi:hypothetical protein
VRTIARCPAEAGARLTANVVSKKVTGNESVRRCEPQARRNHCTRASIALSERHITAAILMRRTDGLTSRADGIPRRRRDEGGEFVERGLARFAGRAGVDARWWC